MRNFLLLFLLLVFQSSLSTLNAVPKLEVRQERFAEGTYTINNPILKHILTNDGTRHIMKV